MSDGQSIWTQRYDDFQEEAVRNILSDFEDDLTGRFLLVIPTGGGKTFTAVKSIHRMFASGLLCAETDRVLWMAHRKELLDQARDTFEIKFKSSFVEDQYFDDRIDYCMRSKVRDTLNASPEIRIVVIDEAHHGAASSYQTVFDNTDLGVLGLTATPSRHDGKPLAFTRESYSIGFPDLVDRGVILRPTVRQIDGGRYDINSVDDDDSLDALNNRDRNQHIINALLDDLPSYSKVVIYVGTKTHVYSLYEQLQASPLAEHYDSIAWVLGGDTTNSRNQPRSDFLAQERSWARSILINVEVLTEGYDDPSLNTVVMARPTRSKLIYMQAIGRAIRRNPQDETKSAFILEVVDDLPNIRYRIDNRWLYSDISDALEPAVEDVSFSDAASFADELTAVYERFNVPMEHRAIPKYDNRNRYSLLLFREYAGPGSYIHRPILINNDNRLSVSNFYNFLSERMHDFAKIEANAKSVLEHLALERAGEAVSMADKQRIYESMENAARAIYSNIDSGPDLPPKHFWITFVAFRRSHSALSPELAAFIDPMINRESIEADLKARSYLPGAILLRLPLPLSGCIGKLATSQEHQAIDHIVEKLITIKAEFGATDHHRLVHDLLDQSVLPLEMAHRNSLVLIARSGDTYWISLP